MGDARERNFVQTTRICCLNDDLYRNKETGTDDSEKIQMEFRGDVYGCALVESGRGRVGRIDAGGGS